MENSSFKAGTKVSRFANTIKLKGVVALYDVSDDWIPIYDKSLPGGFYVAVDSVAINIRTLQWLERLWLN